MTTNAEMERTASEISFGDYVLSNRNENLLATGQRRTFVYNFVQERDIAHPLDDCPAMILFLRGSLPAGIFLIAKAFSNGGLFFSLFGVALIGLMSMYNTHALVWCAHRVYQRLHVPMLAFAEVTEQCCLVGPRILNKYHSLMRVLIDTIIVMDLLLTVGAFTTTVATHSKKLMDHHTGMSINVRFYTLAYFPFLVLLNAIHRNLYDIAPLAFIANLFTIFSIIGNYYYILSGKMPDIKERDFIQSWTRIPLCLGTIVFALTCTTLVMPIENNMKHPHHLVSCPGVLNIGFAISIAVVSANGFLGYWKYGNKITGNIHLILPEEEPLAQCCIISMILAVYLSSSLLFHVAIEIIFRNFAKSIRQNFERKKYYIRMTLIACCVCSSMAIPDVGIFVSLIGSLSRSILTLIAPALIELITCWHVPGMGLLKWRLVKNLVSIIIGLFIIVAGVTANIFVLISTYTQQDYFKKALLEPEEL